ncbi:molybdopterin-guanine dinucleotide biosynthesis protein MobA [Rubripirellula tenax]|uniref:Probable molybdenum cofactor guanylyltransferase n=1 Tax=Rubripirellula tenax TaxID=2528015 RepID=A0A5C6F4E7_9BACT|nr:molybdenum cofactor guanylyltransferase [Rubripirellula tenax]TWU54679.1 molybdopterin-guanine dinucleotide biosynthesis protein MobA [Rubripirellula tenax]
MTGRLLGVVLCGGRSARMGRDKSSLRRADGGTFLKHAIDRLGCLCDQVIISGDAKLPGIVSIADPVAHRGPVVGIAESLEYASEHDFAACFFTPVDVPELTVADLLSLKSAWLESNKTTLAISERMEPLVGIYPVTLLETIERLTESEDRSLFRYFKRDPAMIQTVAVDRTRCRNINTPEDLEDHGR